MFQKLSMRGGLLIGFIGVLITGSQLSASSKMFDDFDNCWAGTCAQRFMCRIDQCNTLYPGDLYEAARNACAAGTLVEFLGCDSGVFADILNDLWDQFIDNIELCLTQYGPDADEPNPESLAICLQGMFESYRRSVEDVLPPTDDPCADAVVPASAYGGFWVGPMDSLRLSAIQSGSLDGKYPASVNTSLDFSAGVNISPGSSYDIRQVPCIKRSLLLASYATKNGSVLEAIDADLDTSDGTNFTVHLSASDLVDAKNVTLISIYFDQNGTPRLAEVGYIEIQDSPISGDWNRDEVLNTQDVVDFLDSYNAQTKRADITDDGIVDPADAVEFTEDYTE